MHMEIFLPTPKNSTEKNWAQHQHLTLQWDLIKYANFHLYWQSLPWTSFRRSQQLSMDTRQHSPRSSQRACAQPRLFLHGTSPWWFLYDSRSTWQRTGPVLEQLPQGLPRIVAPNQRQAPIFAGKEVFTNQRTSAMSTYNHSNEGKWTVLALKNNNNNIKGHVSEK